jgi:hypothetical protein
LLVVCRSPVVVSPRTCFTTNAATLRRIRIAKFRKMPTTREPYKAGSKPSTFK